MTIQLVNAVRVDGDSQSAGAQLTLSAALEAELVARRDAVYLGGDPSVATSAPVGVVHSADYEEGVYADVGPHGTFVRSTGGSASSCLTDWAGYVRDTKPGELLIWKGRRVENLIRYSEHLSYTGNDGWSAVNGCAVTVPTTVTRTGPDGEFTSWIVTRAAQANSVLRQQRSLRRHGRLAGNDLLLPVSHVAGVDIKTVSGGPTTAELRIHTPGGATLVTQVVSITSSWRSYGITFTAPAAKRITALAWATSVLTVTSNAHGYASGSTVRISGCQPSTFDGDYTITGVTTNTFTVALVSDPGTATFFGWAQQGYVFSIAPHSWASTSAGAIEVAYPFVSDRLGYGANEVPEYVPQDAGVRGLYFAGAAVDGVRYTRYQPGNVLAPATGIIAKSVGAALTGVLGVATFPESTNQVTNSEDFSGWTATNVTLSSDTAPNGNDNATLLNDGASAGAHRIQVPGGIIATQDLGSGTVGYLANVSVFAAQPASGQGFVYFEIVDRAGATQTAWFNLSTGVTTNVTVGTADMEPLSGGTWRCIWSVPVGVGGSEIVMRLGMSAAAGTASYTGQSKTVRIWGFSFIGAQLISSSVQQRPIATPYARNDSSVRTQPGSVALVGLDGVLGQNDIAAYAEVTPYFRWTQADKVSYTAPLYFRTQSPQQVFGASSTRPSPYDWDRFGITLRPNASPASEHKSKFGFDLYNGEVTQFYLWSAGKVVKQGDWIVPSDTQPDNLNARGVFLATLVTGATGGSEPSWPGSLNGSVVDGGVTWVRANDNGINGNWEPYNGAHAAGSGTFMTTTKMACFIAAANDYGFFISGAEAPHQTVPQPAVSPVWGSGMRYPIRCMWMGTMGTNDALTLSSLLSTYQSTTGVGMMGVHTMFHRRVRVWSRLERARQVLQALTA